MDSDSRVDVHVVTSSEREGFYIKGISNFEISDRSSKSKKSHCLTFKWPMAVRLFVIIVNRSEETAANVHIDLGIFPRGLG